MKTLKVTLPKKSYEIKIEEGLLKQTGTLIKEIFQGEKIVVVTDVNVAPLYAQRVEDALNDAGFLTKTVVVPAGEESKCKEQLFYLYDEMLSFGLTRTDLIVALGGGVVGDLTGFAAATLLRGIPYVQIPTTLLSQVDSSVGGKVAIDLPAGKNLVGAFYQPKLVIIDPLCLSTLPERVFADGMAEVIKYGAIWDADLFSVLEKLAPGEETFAKIGEIVYNCCDIKRQIVEEDEFDMGLRMLLNFGHTFGHAIEKEYHYKTYTHGEAVAIGMMMALQYGEKQGITPFGTTERMKKLLQKTRLPTETALPKKALIDAMAVDKKGEGGYINLVLLSSLGEARIVKIPKVDF